MVQIIAEYNSITDYIHDSVQNPEILKPLACSECGSHTFSLNGFYHRKSESRGKEVLVKNGELKIRRLKCSGDCKRSYSILPSLIPPLRWYLWCMQQLIISMFMSGISIKKIVTQTSMAKSTVKRWISWAKQKWQIFCNELMSEHTWLSGLSHASGFYSSLFKWRKLSKVMAKLHNMGLAVP